MTAAVTTAPDGLPQGAWLTVTRAWGIGLVILLLPVVLFDRPYLQDFPNHLSRIEIALAIADPALAANYELLPLRPGNAGFDFVMRRLSAVMPVVEAGRLFVLACLVLIATGTLALRRAFGLPFDAVALAALPFIYSASFAYGFLPYLLGLGLALHAMALWVWVGGRHKALRWLLAPVAMLLAAAHFYTLGIFAIFAAAETWQRLDGRHAWRTRSFWLRGLADGLVLLPALLILVLFGEPGELARSTTIEWTIEKPFHFVTTAFGYGPWWMSLTVLAVWIAIVHPLMKWSALGFDHRATVATIAMIAAFLVMPHRLGQLFSVDWRILNCAVLVFIAGVRIAPQAADDSRRPAVRLLMLMSCMAMSLAWLWQPAVAARRDVLAITEGLPPGARVFWMVADRATARWISSVGYGIYHAASHATVRRKILVSTTFTLPGQHPLRMRDPTLRDIGNLSLLEMHLLASDLAERTVKLADVVTRFDYALLYGPVAPDEAVLLPVRRMRLIATEGALRLYAIDRPGS